MSATPAEIAKRLSKAQKAAIFPGPGSPAYARGLESTISALRARQLVFFGYRVAKFTPLGLLVRAELEKEGGA